ncbi:hypothetical protein IAR55_001344 [Kwoniella newhampshirensis]|uniref:Zn(2)-C6 fungal-type domain-containing protein n=1 Tax=Kwoniella newhampshirensis TaxID=1651941 RepID=A0AAW0Z5M4_9TREE
MSSSAEPSNVGPVRPSRSRNGCLVCRSRRLKCDLEKPECRRCIKYGAECVYPAKKLFDPDAVAEKLRRRHKSSSHPSEQSPLPGPSSTASPAHAISLVLPALPTPERAKVLKDKPAVDPMDPVELLMALCRNTRMGQFFIGPLDPPDFLRAAFPVEEDLRCVKDRNPWVEYVTPLLLFPTGEAPRSTEALKLTMMTCGAIHLSFLEARGNGPNSNGKNRELAHRYRWDAMKLLRQAHSDPVELSSDAFIAACTILSCSDILGANVHWRENLRLGRAAIRHRGGFDNILFGASPQPTPLQRCLMEHLVVCELAAAVTTGEPMVGLSQSSNWWNRLKITDVSEPDSIESSTGLHRTIIGLFARVLDLTFEARLIDRGLNTNHDHSRLTAGVPWPNTGFQARVAMLCEEIRVWPLIVAPRITLKRTLDGSLALWHGLHILLIRDLLHKSRTDPAIRHSAEAILDTCARVGDKVEYMNWALLFACSTLDRPAQRDRARDVLKSFRYQCCYEVEVIESIIEECWKRIDDGLDEEACSWREILLEMGCSVLLA